MVPCGFIEQWDPTAAAQTLKAAGLGQVRRGLDGGTDVGCGFERRSGQGSEVPHTLDTGLELAWGRDWGQRQGGQIWTR